MADIVLAIDVDSPAFETDASFQACLKLARKMQERESRPIVVKSVKEHDVGEIVDMITQG